MHWSCCAPPHFLLHRLFPVSDPLSYHTTTRYTCSSPEEHIDFILGTNSKPALRNYKIRKLLDTTLVSSSERLRDALEGCERLREEGRTAVACRREASWRFPSSTKELHLISLRHILSRGLKTDAELPINEEYILSSVLPFRPLSILSGSKPRADLLTIRLWLSVAKRLRQVMWSVRLQVFIMLYHSYYTTDHQSGALLQVCCFIRSFKQDID